ncbi:MmcQ/YjbR family DNA-binding protein [Sporolactobacillus nakayamae]|uniref:Predicted DNA-binding protein, MmcQ/YjbR family n=1 Tax=Sporolactobacillus nakayamae TaxID=269670 RepID=A0A1I2PI91_9BACL|nr:MmcQ/YjbR family DNA-binding protein [Sporolactobacillus nakayamae]SFG15153.1 Predicted DNA-binding protein, MmcQ/YjbR family [Sporolactobacillus nakayamae]
MNTEWIDAYCLEKKGVERDYKEEWQATRYMIRGKIFAMRGGDKNGLPIITVKLLPDFGARLREEYEAIVPGYYMNKTHWNSLYLDKDVSEEVLRIMLDQGYLIVLRSLSKKVQEEIGNLIQ